MEMNILLPRTAGTRREVIAAGFVLALCAVIQFGYAVQNDFVWDAADVFLGPLPPGEHQYAAR